jgi:hypothetical protein
MMRRKEKEVTYPPHIEDIIAHSSVCRLAMSDDGQPYVIPLCYGYKDNTFYLHSATEGRKLDILRKNDRVCIEIDIDCEIVKESDNACSWSMKYRCVVGFGKASLIYDTDLKREALNIIMGHYCGSHDEYTFRNIENIIVIRIDVERMTGKQSGY